MLDILPIVFRPTDGGGGGGGRQKCITRERRGKGKRTSSSLDSPCWLTHGGGGRFRPAARGGRATGKSRKYRRGETATKAATIAHKNEKETQARGN